MRKIYETISILLSAPAVAGIVVIIFSLFSTKSLGSMSTMESVLIGLIFLSFVPSAVVLAFARIYSVKMDITDREKRTPIFIVTIINYLVSALIFYTLENHVMFLLSVSYFVVTLFIMFINLFWKISVHAAGFSGPFTAICYVFGGVSFISFLLLIPLLYSRYKLGHHTKAQLFSGVLISIFITYLIYFIWW
ncbi:MAG: hypothetical protein J7L45_01175 [Candidatus Aenigmarchaeota archaeon]|nr:hypothetical protein [Candidatus Aenigmarchaeota archaeon]